MKKQLLVLTLALGATLSAKSQNPYLPMWEYIPDAEPYVFEDPDHPGRQRVYIYGSHDSMVSEYCGRELVTWSAPVDSLDRWRYEGVIFEVKRNARGEYMDGQQRGDVLYAPDVVETTDEAGRRCYYLYPNNQSGGRKGMVAKSYRPDGPFEVINWDPASPSKTIGMLGFDPAVFRDDDGRVYGYWGFCEPYVAELDPTTMATVKPGTQVLHNYINGYKQPGIFRFFEASSIRKVKDKYILIYSRMTGQNEFGLPTSNYTLAYAYSSSPMGPFTYGGTIIDGRGRDLDAQGTPVFTATPNGNTHGSICEVNGRWWVFYHRQTGLDEYSRQAMVAPIEVEVEEGGAARCASVRGHTPRRDSLQRDCLRSDDIRQVSPVITQGQSLRSTIGHARLSMARMWLRAACLTIVQLWQRVVQPSLPMRSTSTIILWSTTLTVRLWATSILTSAKPEA